MKFLKNSDPEFEQYFGKYYLNDTTKLASCMRIGCGLEYSIFLGQNIQFILYNIF